jgi:hypothetical protein
MPESSTIPNPLALLAAVAALACALAAGVPAEAATLKAQAVSVEVPAEPPAGSGLAPADRGDAVECTRVRRRLWVEGEGWIVRRVSLCR